MENSSRPEEILVSIILPVFNTGDLFAASYQSVLDQGIAAFELFVVDDGSSNDTYDIIAKYAQADQRIKLNRNIKNVGVAVSRNLALKKAQGQYIAFLDCGDIWAKDKLTKQIELLNKKKADLCYGGYSYFQATPENILREYRVPATVSYQELLKENFLGCSTVLLKSASLKNQSFPLGYSHEDYVFWLMLIKQGLVFVGLSDNLVYYRVGGRSSNKYRAAKNRWKIYRKAEKLSFISSLYYFSVYACRMMKKYAIKK